MLTDPQNRVLVVMRYRDAANPNNHDPNNSIVLAYNNDLMSGNTLQSSDWKFITLDNTNMGNYEPTYDASMWNARLILDLFYEPALGTSPFTTQNVSVLEWNEQQYFAGDLNSDGSYTAADVSVLMNALSNESGFEAANNLTDANSNSWPT